MNGEWISDLGTATRLTTPSTDQLFLPTTRTFRELKFDTVNSNMILPAPPKRKFEMYLIGFLHLNNTLGVAMATSGGAPGPTDGVMNPTLNEIGNWIMIMTLLFAYIWMFPTYKKIRRFLGTHPNAKPAQHMFWASFMATPLWVVRLGYNTAYAFHHDSTLDPVSGNFETRLVLLFGTWLMASIPLAVGGWLGMKIVPRDQSNTEVLVVDAQTSLQVERRRTHDELRREYQRNRSNLVATDNTPMQMQTPDTATKERHGLHILRTMISSASSV